MSCRTRICRTSPRCEIASFTAPTCALVTTGQNLDFARRMPQPNPPMTRSVGARGTSVGAIFHGWPLLDHDQHRAAPPAFARPTFVLQQPFVMRPGDAKSDGHVAYCPQTGPRSVRRQKRPIPDRLTCRLPLLQWPANCAAPRGPGPRLIGVARTHHRPNRHPRQAPTGQIPPSPLGLMG